MKDLEIFSALDEAEKNDVVRLARPVLIKKGETVFSEGTSCDKIYFIRKGSILLYKVSIDGKEMSLDILNQDDIFGEHTIFDEAIHSFNAKALEDTFVCVCTRDDFMELLKNPKVSIKMMKHLTNKLDGYTDQMASMAFNDVQGRIINMIKKLNGKYGMATSKGVKIDVKLSHQDIANLVNASRVMVSNILGALKNEGVITIDEKYIYVVNKTILEVDM